MAEAWHKAGVANGGTSIEDPPGVRPNGAYLAYLRDPMVTRSSRLPGKSDLTFPRAKTEKGRPSGRFFRSGGRRRPPLASRAHQRH
jgi:hypothetical protein